MKIMPQLVAVVVHTLIHGRAVRFDTMIFYDARKPLVVFVPVDFQTLAQFFGRIFNGGLRCRLVRRRSFHGGLWCRSTRGRHRRRP